MGNFGLNETIKCSGIRNTTYVKINQQYIQKPEMVQLPVHIETLNIGFYKITIVCLSFTPLVDLFSNILRSDLLAFSGFFHSRFFSRCRRNKDQQLTVNISESHKLSRMFCITIYYNCKRTRQLRSNKSCSYNI